MTSSSAEGTWLRHFMFIIIQSSKLRAVDSVKLSVCISASIQRLYLMQTHDWGVCMYEQYVRKATTVLLCFVPGFWLTLHCIWINSGVKLVFSFLCVYSGEYYSEIISHIIIFSGGFKGEPAPSPPFPPWAMERRRHSPPDKWKR